jgi:hypothetical protein
VLALAARAGDSPSSVGTGRSARRPLAGFAQIGLRITRAAGGVAEWCALLADSDVTRAQGLMRQTDLRGYDAMAFRFDAPSAAEFYMFQTKVPLSLAWFDADGRFVGAVDMDPCTAVAPDGCRRYPPPRPVLTALEVPRGGLPRLGLGRGARLALAGGDCT